MAPDAPCTRLAPSPTGPLHLGHALAFVGAWTLARRLGWRVILRLDDLDAARVRAGDADPIGTLRWLGLDWDGEPVRQSNRMDRYVAAMERLAASGLVYTSPHSRSEVREAIRALGAPHEGETPNRFPASLRPPAGAAWGFRDHAVNHRMRVEPGAVRVRDALLGEHVMEPAQEHGDFLVWTRGGVPSYQLACTVDDLELGVSDVVRGQDLLASASLQQRIAAALGLPHPNWWHLPLVRDAEGRRLAKRDGAEGLPGLRAAGVAAERVRGLVGWWLGIHPLEPASPQALVAGCHPERLAQAARDGVAASPRSATPELMGWLRGADVGTDTLADHA
jgi:glutamyl-tRNA synthetase